jgi:hypothetical protein
MRQPQIYFWRKTMTAKEHNKLIGVFMLIQGGLQIFGGLMAALIYGGMGLGMMSQARSSEQQTIAGVILVLAIVIVPMVLLFAGIFLMAGWKMFKEKQGARTWGIVASIIALFGFPLGTALGIYGLWFLFGEQGKQFYMAGGNQNMFNMPPPPPNQWR